MAVLVRRLSVAEIKARCGDAQRNPGTRVGQVVRSRLDPRTHEQRLADEAARWRKSLREEQDRHDATRVALLQANRQLLGVYLRERFRDPDDFDLLVGIDLVVDERGAIVWRRVVTLADELLSAKPHLAAAPDGLPVRGGVSAVEFFTNQSV